MIIEHVLGFFLGFKDVFSYLGFYFTMQYLFVFYFYEGFFALIYQLKVSHRANSDYDSISDSFDLAPVYIKSYPTEILFELMTPYEDQFIEFTHWYDHVFF